MEEEEVLNKSGPELFKELRRFYSVAQVEDYFKHGAGSSELRDESPPNGPKTG
ncbi:unnamed protein product [Effrenium voratum]|uniref:Uncharacterized protein n=1 Tax=Effrenium voratum TaxID=2562239 RepID=A0AA36N8L1_9DINO|nr:unnamed protein product [Effrenium voratum]